MLVPFGFLRRYRPQATAAGDLERYHAGTSAFATKVRFWGKWFIREGNQ